MMAALSFLVMAFPSVPSPRLKPSPLVEFCLDGKSIIQTNRHRLDDDNASKPRVHHLRCLPLVWMQCHPNEEFHLNWCHLDERFHLDSLNPNKIQSEGERFEWREGIKGQAIIWRKRVVVIHQKIA